MRRVVEVFADEVGDAYLILDRQAFGLVARALGDGAGRLRGDVDHLVALLDVLDVAVHVSQLAADYLHALLDEVGRHHRQLALVGDGVFLIDGDQRVDHVLGAARHRIVHRDRHDRRLLVGHVALHGGAVGVGRRRERILDYGDGFFQIGRVHEQGLVHDHLPDGRGDRIAVFGQNDPLGLLPRHELVLEVRQLDLAVSERGDLQRKLLLGVVVDEIDFDRRTAVQVRRAQPFPHRVVDRQVEALDHLRHQPVRLEDIDLVVYVAAVLESHQIAERAQIRVAALAAVLHEDGRRPAVYFRGACQIVIGRSQTDDRREREPVPVGQNHLNQVVERDAVRVFGLFVQQMRIDVLFCHGRSYLVRVMMSVATEIAVPTSER